ncbi:retrovirus-related Pol polyprotein from transposon 297 [Trichonephila clavipes]|nr:retrovirus-related Pol polyprotein from transposon 297 [Trichonephila clavipes]
MIRWALKLSEFNSEWEHRPGAQNVVAKVLSRNPVDNVEGSQISCAALRALALNSREQLIQEHREDPELGHINRYLEIPDDGSINATVCEGWSQDFKLIDGLLFYAREKYCTTLGELSVYIPKSLREAIMQEFHDLPLAGHHRLDIKHIKTVTYRPQANLTERVNRTLVQMIACFVEENHNNWDRFLHEFSFALRTAVNETPAELFLGRKIITPFRKLVRVTNGAEYVGGNIETFHEARQNMQRQHKTSNSGKCRRSRKPSGIESKSCKSNKGTAGLEDLRIKRTRPVVSTGTAERSPKDYQRNTGIDSLPQNSLRRRRLSMEVLDGDSADRRT